MNVLVEEDSLRAIADAIREKAGGSDTYKPGQMAATISCLDVGTGGTLIEKTVTAPGTYTAADDGADGYSSVINAIPWYEVPYDFDNSAGYTYNGKWMLGGSTVSYSDMYTVKAGHKYLIGFGADTGTRFRSIFTTQDPSTATSEITGTWVKNATNPAAYASLIWTASEDGYLTITKDNAGKANIPSYVFDITIIE